MNLTKVNRILKALRLYAEDPDDRPILNETPTDQYVVLSRAEKGNLSAVLFAVHVSPDREAFPIFGFPLTVGEASGPAETVQLATEIAQITEDVMHSTLATAILERKGRVVLGVVSEQRRDGSLSVLYATIYRDGEAPQVAYAGPSYTEAQAQFRTLTTGQN